MTPVLGASDHAAADDGPIVQVDVVGELRLAGQHGETDPPGHRIAEQQDFHRWAGVLRADQASRAGRFGRRRDRRGQRHGHDREEGHRRGQPGAPFGHRQDASLPDRLLDQVEGASRNQKSHGYADDQQRIPVEVQAFGTEKGKEWEMPEVGPVGDLPM